LDCATTDRFVGTSGTVIGTPNAVDVFDDNAVAFTEVIATTFTSYAVPLVSSVKVKELVDWVDRLLVPSGETGEPHEPPFIRKYTS
jgi:hypothetical protein